MKNMAACNYIISLLGLLISVCIMNAASEFPLDFTVNGPGPGFWPFSLGAALGIAAVILFIYTFLHKEDLSQTRVALTLPANKRVYLMMGVIAVYCVLINLLGFYPASAVLIPVVMYFMDYHNKKVIALTTVCTIIFIYLVFGELLHTQMPQSIFLE